MDTQAQHTERGCPCDTPETADGGAPAPASAAEGATPERSRSASVTGPLARALDRIPGGRLTAAFVVSLVVLLVTASFVVQPFGIPSGSMEPAYRAGDRIIVNKLAYRFGARPERGDVVVFDGSGYFGDGDYIKRVVGVGADHVVCCDRRGRIEVNDRPVDETYLRQGEAPSRVPFDVVVPEGRLFVLGDNRSHSRDSRDHLGSPGGGMIPFDRVVGRADATVWPPSRWSSGHGTGAFDRIPAPGGAHG